jgi:hypothetical protein
VPDDRMLWKGTGLMRLPPFTTINSVLSNAAELRRQSRHVVGVQMEKRSPMTERDVASEHPNLNEGSEPLQGGTPRTPPARRPAVLEFKNGSPSKLQRRCVTCVSAHPQWNELNRCCARERTDSGRDASHATGQIARADECPMTGCCGWGTL